MITDDSLKLLTGITELLPTRFQQKANIKTSIINVGTINHHDWVQMSAKSDNTSLHADRRFPGAEQDEGFFCRLAV